MDQLVAAHVDQSQTGANILARDYGPYTGTQGETPDTAKEPPRITARGPDLTNGLEAIAA